jgi:hypothetical protein
MSEFWMWIGQALVVAFGWWVVHRLSSARDRDKSRREMVAKSADQLIDALSAHLVIAHEYHLKTRDVTAELKIKMSIQDMAMRATGLSEISSDESVLAPCRSEIAAVRRAVTGAHFEDEHDGPLNESSQQVQDVAEAVSRAKRAVLRLKHRQFPAI